MSRIRVAYLPARLDPGGAERQMLALAERLPRDRFRVDFITVNGSGQYDDRARAAGARVKSLGEAAPLGASMPVRNARRVSKILRYAALVRAGKYDVVDAWLYPSDVLAALARPLTGTPVIVSGRRNVDPQDQFGPAEHLVGMAVRRLTDMVVANSAAAAANAIANQDVDPERLRVIHNGVELPEPVGETERAALRHDTFGIGDDEILVGCVANYRPVKRLDLLIDAVAPLVHGGLPIRVELIGDGLQRPDLERRIRAQRLDGRVCLHGAVSRPEPLYDAFDMTVQTSDREGLPNVLLEAGAAGRAIVATAAGGTPEIVMDGKTGMLVPVGDVEAVRAALHRLAVDRPLRDRLGSAVRDHVATTFGMDRFVAEFASLYETLVAARRLRT